MATEFKLSYTANEINQKLGKIDGLAAKSEIPTKTSDLTNDSGYLTEHQSLDGFATESYVDSQISAIPTPDVSGQITAAINEIPQADWSQTDSTQKDFIKNKPDIATDDEIIDMLIEFDTIIAVSDSDGSILAENGEILLW